VLISPGRVHPNGRATRRRASTGMGRHIRALPGDRGHGRSSSDRLPCRRTDRRV